MSILSRSTLRGAPSGGVLTAGNGSGTCERWRTQPRPRAVLGQPRRALWTRPGPTTVKGIKAKMPRWRAARRGVHRKCTHRPEQSGHSARSNPGTAPCRRADPLALRGRKKRGMRATPWPRAETGADILCVDFVGWAKALARYFPTAKTLVRRAHAVTIRNYARPRGHGARQAFPR